MLGDARRCSISYALPGNALHPPERILKPPERGYLCLNVSSLIILGIVLVRVEPTAETYALCRALERTPAAEKASLLLSAILSKSLRQNAMLSIA